MGAQVRLRNVATYIKPRDLNKEEFLWCDSCLFLMTYDMLLIDNAEYKDALNHK